MMTRRLLRLLFLLMVPLVGCSQGATLVRETDNGGVVTFIYKEDRGGPTLSTYRKDAIDIMRKKCPQGYTIVKEGETRGETAVSSLEGTEDQVTRRWAFQFRCQSR